MKNKNTNFDIIFCALLFCVTVLVGAYQAKEQTKTQQEKQKSQSILEQRKKLLRQQQLDRIQKIEQEKAVKDSLIQETDNKIDSVYWIIDSLQCDWRERALDSFANNDLVVLRSEIQKKLNNLNTNNKYQITKAYKYALREYPYINRIQNNDSVFYTFFHDDAIKKIHEKYKKNCRNINQLQAQFDYLPQPAIIQKNILSYFDSATNAQVRHQYEQIDSLLNKKNQIISHRHR